MSLYSRRFVQISNIFRNKKVLHHQLLVLLHPETKLKIMARIHRTSKLVQHSLKEVQQREVVGLLHMLNVVEHTQVNVLIAKAVASSVFKRVTSWENAKRNGKAVEIRAAEPNLHQFFHQTELYLQEPLLVLVEGQFIYPPSLASKRKRFLQMLSLAWLKTLLLMFMFC